MSGVLGRLRTTMRRVLADRLLVVVLTLGVLGVALSFTSGLLIGGMTTDDACSARPTVVAVVDPVTAAGARVAAERLADVYARGDAQAYWDALDEPGRRAYSVADFERLFAEHERVPPMVVGARLTGPARAEVSLAGRDRPSVFVHDGVRWRWTLPGTGQVWA
ncbi:MAG TPA: hypothetical protein VGD67_13835 [Pseudonocardiaceae bacterium]